MLAAKPAIPDLASMKTAIIVVAIALVIFWRTALKVVIMILAIAAIVLLASGVFVLFASMHHAAM